MIKLTPLIVIGAIAVLIVIGAIFVYNIRRELK